MATKEKRTWKEARLSTHESPLPHDQSETPYFDALLQYVEQDVLTFHVPGHQQGRGADTRFRRFMAEHGLAADITQVLGMDDIHRPETVCKRAQELAAQAYGADHSYFLINGSSSGNQIMFMAALRPGEVVLVPRNAHRSIIGAAIVADARAIFYEVPYDPEMGVTHPPALETVAQACLDHPEARALFITSPTYYGLGADVQALVSFAHKRDLIALVDEAWGPHLHFHPHLPVSAVVAGADLVVQSTHKLLAGMSQASMLHLRGQRIDRIRLESVLKMLLSTSPNCLLVASLDVARRQMVEQGLDLWGKAMELAQAARRSINRIQGLHCFGSEMVGRPGVHGWDPTRLIITARDIGLTGYELEKRLRHEHNIQIEMSEFFNIVVLLTPGHTPAHVERLLAALRAVATEPAGSPLSDPCLHRPTLPYQAMSMRAAFDASQQAIPLRASAGRVCAEVVTPYPPGIPLLCPGEIVTDEIIAYLREELAAGAHIQGPFDQQLDTIRVVT